MNAYKRTPKDVCREAIVIVILLVTVLTISVASPKMVVQYNEYRI